MTRRFLKVRTISEFRMYVIRRVDCDSLRNATSIALAKPPCGKGSPIRVSNARGPNYSKSHWYLRTSNFTIACSTPIPSPITNDVILASSLSTMTISSTGTSIGAACYGTTAITSVAGATSAGTSGVVETTGATIAALA